MPGCSGPSKPTFYIVSVKAKSQDRKQGAMMVGCPARKRWGARMVGGSGSTRRAAAEGGTAVQALVFSPQPQIPASAVIQRGVGTMGTQALLLRRLLHN